MTDQKTKTPEQIQEEQFQAWVHQMVNFMIRGLLSVLSGARAEIVLLSACAAFGRVMGEIYGAPDVVAIGKFRKACREAFVESMGKVQPQTGPMPDSDQKPKA